MYKYRICVPGGITFFNTNIDTHFIFAHIIGNFRGILYIPLDMFTNIFDTMTRHVSNSKFSFNTCTTRKSAHRGRCPVLSTQSGSIFVLHDHLHQPICNCTGDQYILIIYKCMQDLNFRSAALTLQQELRV